MANVNMAAFKLMHRGAYEAVDELEDSLLRSFVNFQSQLTPPYHISTPSAAQHAHLSQALLCGVILNPTAAPSHVTHLTAITTDGYASFVCILLRLVNEFYPKLLDQTRTQIVWLLRQLITLSAADVDSLCLSLLRQVAGGDLSPGNIWLAAQLLEVMKSNWSWFIGIPTLSTTALYTYLRLLPDHAMAKGPTFTELKQNETLFCVQILRERFQDCIVIGRDLVRLLQDVACIPDFEPVWRDLLNNPAAFKAPGFADIAQLYVARTPTRYLASRITPEMENQIRFMLTHVRMGSQRRYQTWFAQRFLSSPESETLVCDLIRFICCVHHPTNQILQSDIVPRWAIVGWLLKCCKSNHVEANAKLALFYDWLFFMSKTDNIMNIEPAILLMVYSIPKYVDMTHTLLEFLFLLVEHYDPVRKDLIQKGVTSSIDILVGKGVVRSLEPLSACSLVASWLREKLVVYFSAYCKSDPSEGPKQKPELLHQEQNSFDNMQIAGAGIKGGIGNREQILGVGGEGLSANSPSMDLPPGANLDDFKTGEMDSTSRKRRRVGPAENLYSEVQQNFERLSEALGRSQELAITVLEKLLSSFLTTISDLPLGDKYSKDASRGESGMDGLVLSGLNAPGDAPPFTVAKFASQITEVLKKGGYELFSPLQKLPSDRPEGDETSSLTSSLLRLYVANSLNQQQLCQLLVCWHREGLAVGARLLCYVSRLAEEIEPSSRTSQANGLPVAVEAEHLLLPLGKCDEEAYDSASNGDGDEEGELTEAPAADGKQEHRKNGITAVVSSRFGTNKKSSQATDLQNAGDMHYMRLRTVANAFKMYEEFLKQTGKGLLSLQGDGVLSQNQGLQNRAGETLAKSEGSDVEADNSEAELLSDLEACFVWNTSRFLRVLPSVFRYLPKLSTSKDEILRLLISSIDPLELSNYEFRLILGEFAIIGDLQEGLARLIKNSLKWEFMEQQIFWRLLLAEMQASPPSTVMYVLKLCSSLLNPQVNSEALSGLLLLLRYQAPTHPLVNAVLSLPSAFGRFAAVVLSSWMSSHHSQLLACLQNMNSGSPRDRQKKAGDDGEDTANAGFQRYSSTALGIFLNSFDNTQFIRNVEEKNLRMTRAAEVRRALLKLAGGSNANLVTLGSLHGSNEALENHQDRS